MPIVTNPNIPFGGNGFDWLQFDVVCSQLLTDGTLFCHTNTGTNWILTPDRFGSYVNGFWRKVGGSEFNHAIVCSHVLANGRAMMQPGHFGTSVLAGVTSVYDPVSETIDIDDIDYTVPGVQGIFTHTVSAITDDGRLVSPRWFLPANAPPRDGNYVQSPVSWDESRGGNFRHGEAGLCLLPDGTFLSAEASGNAGQTLIDLNTGVAANYHRLFRLSPGYSAEMIAQGSSSIAAGCTAHDMSQKLYDLFPSDWQFESLNTDTPNIRYIPRWSALGANAGSHELGPLLWHPQLQRAVLFGGSGFIFGFNPFDASGPTVESYGRMGKSEFHQMLGTVASLNPLVIAVRDDPIEFRAPHNPVVGGGNGPTLTVSQIATQMNTSGSWDLSSGEPFGNSRRRSLFVWADDDRRRTFTYGSVTANDANRTITVNGLAVVTQHPGARFNLAVGQQVSMGDKYLRVQDNASCILPDGTMLVMAGGDFWWGNGLAWPPYTGFFKWRPGQTGLVYADPNYKVTAGGASYFPVNPIMLPSGEVWLGKANLGPARLYQPTAQELVPYSESIRPTIEYAPSVALRGGTFTIRGVNLTGVHQGGAFGDDKSLHTNFPIARLRDTATNRIYYCRTHQFSYRGIQPGRVSTCNVTIPDTVPAGTYRFEVVTNGIASVQPHDIEIRGIG
jgi:hypothetical protein